MTIRGTYTLGPGTYTNFANNFSDTNVVLTGNITFNGDTSIYCVSGNIDTSAATITVESGKTLVLASEKGTITVGNITAPNGEIVFFTLASDTANGVIRCMNTGSTALGYTTPVITCRRVSIYGDFVLYGSFNSSSTYRPITVNCTDLSMNQPGGSISAGTYSVTVPGGGTVTQVYYRSSKSGSFYLVLFLAPGVSPNRIMITDSDAMARRDLVTRTGTKIGILSINEINAEFGRGKDLNAYRGTLWYKDDASYGYFPSSPNRISILDFYGTRLSAPYTSYYIDVTSSKTITLPSTINGNIALLAVAGGGGGGGVIGNGSATLEGGGGGGAGGVIWHSFNLAVVPSGTLTITIGAGGPGSYYTNPQYGNGQNTVVVHKNPAGSTIWSLTAVGGGYGAMGYYDQIQAGSGGSGGGGSPWYGASLQGAGTAGQGNNGARGVEDRTGGGGGGYASAGGDYGGGGNGSFWSYYGLTVEAGGGGGSAGDYRVTSEGAGGMYGGGQGGIFRDGTAGGVNKGGGGGGAWGGTGGNGGSGRVVIWLTASALPA